MKKLFYLLYLLPVLLMASCSNDDDLAEVDLTLTLSGVTQVKGNFYAVSGDDITIDGIGVKSLTNKNATITRVMYYFEGIPLIGNPADPFLGSFSTEGLKSGTYALSFTGWVVQEDKSITTVACNFPVTIVSSAEDLPEGAPEIGTYSSTVTVRPDK